MKRTNATHRAIGGFFPLELTSAMSGIPACSVLDLWGVTDDNAVAFRNARSALSYILKAHRPICVWAPAFICPEALSAIPAGMAISYYSIAPDLSPDVAWLEARVKDGDCVLGVDYFGRSPGPDFLHLVSQRPDILWIEDRAQALHPAAAPWGDWVVYSPRKLFGVPDGGIAIRSNNKTDVVAQPCYEPVSDMAFMAASLHRFEEPDGTGRADGYRLYQESEAAMSVGPVKMSRLTRILLTMIDPTAPIARRKENYDVLADVLAPFAVFKGNAGSFAPLGFPVRHGDCDAVCSRLRDKGVFVARHWRCLPSPQEAFPWEHDLSEEIMTLPCDHRYGPDDMQFVADVFLDAAG